MSKGKSIVLTEDLIDEWVKRTGKDRKLLEEMLKLHHKYIDHVIENEPTALILSLPHLGTLRFNYYMAKNYLKRHDNGLELNKPIVAKMNLLKEIMYTEGNKIKNFNRPAILKQFYKRTRKTYLALYERYYDLVKILEDYHNEFYMEKMKERNGK